MTETSSELRNLIQGIKELVDAACSASTVMHLVNPEAYSELLGYIEFNEDKTTYFPLVQSPF